MTPQSEMKPELKPCPFCGGNAQIYQHTGYGKPYKKGLFQVECADETTDEGCGCKIDEWWSTEQEAIEAWNTRSSGGQGLVAINAQEVIKFLEFSETEDDVPPFRVMPVGCAKWFVQKGHGIANKFGTPEARAVKWPEKRYPESGAMFFEEHTVNAIRNKVIDECIAHYKKFNPAVVKWPKKRTSIGPMGDDERDKIVWNQAIDACISAYNAGSGAVNKEELEKAAEHIFRWGFSAAEHATKGVQYFREELRKAKDYLVAELCGKG